MMESRDIVRTVLGDIAKSECGVVFAHEHLVLDNPLIAAAFPHILLNDPAIATREVSECWNVGVRTMVDAMPCAAGRHVERLAKISRSTKVNIVASTGLHHERYYGPHHWTSQVGAEELAQLFVDDITIGIDAFDYTGPLVHRTGHKAGIIKVASGGESLNERDFLLFRAAALAHSTTGAPVLTHCEGGRGALEQIETFKSLGVHPQAILLSHVDKVEDVNYHLELASAGAWLVFDQSLRQHERSLPFTARLIVEMARAGFAGQIIVGTDGARRDLWHGYSGRPGLCWLASSFRHILEAEGLPPEQIERIFVGNPAEALALRQSQEDSGTASRQS
jgi:5-phospho-D-xylono-1,4-lactonase